MWVAIIRLIVYLAFIRFTSDEGFLLESTRRDAAMLNEHSVADAIDNSGVRLKHHRATANELDTAYIAACRSGEIEHTKAPHRERVLRFILDNHGSKVPRLMTNPGPQWIFERSVERELGKYKAYFIGIERSQSILEYGLRWMPGNRKMTPHMRSMGSDIVNFVSAKATVLNARVEYVVRQMFCMQNVPMGVFKNNRNVKKTTKSHFKGFTGAWIDIFGPLGTPELAKFLRHLPQLFSSGPIPFAFTFLYGRDRLPFPESDNGCPLESRAEAIKCELTARGGRFDIRDTWWYPGWGGCRMATVCGVWRDSKRSARKNPRCAARAAIA